MLKCNKLVLRWKLSSIPELRNVKPRSGFLYGGLSTWLFLRLLGCQILMVEVLILSFSTTGRSVSFKLGTVVCCNTKRKDLLLSLFVSYPGKTLTVLEPNSNYSHVAYSGSLSRSLALQQDFSWFSNWAGSLDNDRHSSREEPQLLTVDKLGILTVTLSTEH